MIHCVFKDSMLEVKAKARHRWGQAEFKTLVEKNMKLITGMWVA